MGTKEVVTFSLLFCVVGLIKRVPFSAFLLTSAIVGESDSGSDMEGYGELEEDDDAEEEGECIFGLGELVEFWDGTCVRGYWTNSGQPAFVKRVEGGGVCML
jgi:hypothetical protein